MCLSLIANTSFNKASEETEEEDMFVEDISNNGNNLSKRNKGYSLSTEKNTELKENSMRGLEEKKMSSKDSWKYFYEESIQKQNDTSLDEKDYDGIYK